jgi:hypothetical protein
MEVEKNMKNEEKFFNRSRKVKTLSILAFVAIAAVGLGTATLMSFYLEQTSGVTVTESLLTWDNTAAEQLETTENFNCMPGSTTEYNHWLNLSASATENKTVKLSILDTGAEPAEGITMELFYYDTDHWTLLLNETTGTTTYEMSPGENLQIKTVYTVDEYVIASGDYEFTFTIEKP